MMQPDKQEIVLQFIDGLILFRRDISNFIWFDVQYNRVCIELEKQLDDECVKALENLKWKQEASHFVGRKVKWVKELSSFPSRVLGLD